MITEMKIITFSLLTTALESQDGVYITFSSSKHSAFKFRCFYVLSRFLKHDLKLINQQAFLKAGLVLK